jgi:hypothetical protein
MGNSAPESHGCIQFILAGAGVAKVVAETIKPPPLRGDGFIETQQTIAIKSVFHAAAVGLVLGVCDLFSVEDGIKRVGEK